MIQLCVSNKPFRVFLYNVNVQPDPEPSLVMKNHLVLDIRVKQFMLVINTVCREHLQVQAFCSQRQSARPMQL